ncbi:MAG: PEP-CTERM sorting domain-containing protein [Verrucomicrobia bacterium]|nr:PEP-CTERM sorting domain-containing protein [Verrucomicrobiota bacterium]
MGQTDPDGKGGYLSPVYRYVPDDQATITGWTFSSTGLGENSYLSKDENYGPMADGNYGLRLNVGDSISQSLLLSQGGNYSLSFNVDRWQVAHNLIFMDFGSGRTLVDGSSVAYNFNFNVAANSNLVLSFGFVADPNADPSNASDEDLGGSGVMLDNIRLTSSASVPEPSALSLLAVGLGLVLRRCRRTV